MKYTKSGIKSITEGDFETAFSLLEKGYFEMGETQSGCYLAQMYYDERITPRTEDSLMKSMLLWHMTKNQVPSSRHKLGVTLFSSLNSVAKNKGLQLIKSAADENYPVSFCVLGVLAYHNGNYDDAVNYFSKYTGINKDKKAMLMYAESLTQKNTPDISLAEKIYSLCAEQFNDDTAYLKLSEIYTTPEFKDATKSFLYLTKAADLGNIDAMDEVGRRYFIGNQILKDYPNQNYELAYKYLSQAYKHGNANAASCLGSMYAFGNYVDKDINKAIALYDEAQANGVDTYNLKGNLYYMSYQYDLAFECFKSAYDKGDKSLLSLFFDVAYSLFSQADDMQEYLVRLALDCENQGYSSNDIALMLGRAYFYENNVVYQDLVKAENYLRQCSNVPEASYIIGKIAAYGESNYLEPEDAESYLITASNAGIVDAMLVLGKLYHLWHLNGKAVNMLMKAYNNGCKEAAQEISEMYRNGDVTGRKDKKKAAEWEAKAK